MKQLFILLASLILLFGCTMNTNTPIDINTTNQSEYPKEVTETITCIFTSDFKDTNKPQFTCEYYFMSPDPSLSPQKGCDLFTNDSNKRDCTFKITRPKGTSVIVRSSYCNERFGYTVGDSNGPQREFKFSC